MHTAPPARPRHFLFISSNASWGGSEELWSSAAERLAVSGHVVAARVSYDKTDGPRLNRLSALGCSVRGGRLAGNRLSRSHSLAGRVLRGLRRLAHIGQFRFLVRQARKQDLIVISQGGNHDGTYLASICLRMGLPYVLISQKATEMYWPTDAALPRFRAAYAGALHSYFVSQHNRRLTEEQLGHPVANASVVRNPFLVPWQRDNHEWPDMARGVRLACVGRLYPTDKGQDLLLRVLAQPKWRERPVSVTFHGDGPQGEGLTGMARFLGLNSVTFAGFTDDVQAIWKTHHALVLPSRCEGLPLAVVEAMLCGRVPIVTDVAGNSEVIEDGKTGFLAAAPTEDAFDAALERAWQRRDEWHAMGIAAATAIRELVPADPARALADMLLEVIATPATGCRPELCPATLAPAEQIDRG